MKYHPFIITTPEALHKALNNDASVILVDTSLLPEVLDTLNQYCYKPLDIPSRSGQLFRHPEATDIEIHDPMGIL